MNALHEMAYEEAVARAKTSLEKEGYRVNAKPQKSQVPSFLKGFIPDLIAHKDGEGVVVGIKTIPPREADNDRIAYFAKEVRKHEGWRFDLYLARPRQEVLDAPLQPSREELASELAIVRKIASNDDPRAALIYAWGLLESVARLLVLNERRGEAKRYKPASIVGMLVSEGFIDDGEGRELYDFADSRNLIVHGFTKAEVSRERVGKLIDIISRLLDELSLNDA
jgi:uncharacterized protein YutE (UPF0331/DUF86 family)